MEHYHPTTRMLMHYYRIWCLLAMTVCFFLSEKQQAYCARTIMTCSTHVGDTNSQDFTHLKASNAYSITRSGMRMRIGIGHVGDAKALDFPLQKCAQRS